MVNSGEQRSANTILLQAASARLTEAAVERKENENHVQGADNLQSTSSVMVICRRGK